MGRYNPTAAATDELRHAGIEPTEVKQSGGGHHKIYFILNGKPRFIVCANSPSDWRAERNNRSIVRRIINQTKGEMK